MEQIKEKIKTKIEDVKQAQDIVKEQQHIAFLKGEMLGLKITLEIIENGEKNENKKV